jgi:transcriptional regulator with XRE-family HTH domain
MLKQARLEAGFESHGALAKRLNVSRSLITKAENAAHPVPSDALLAAWAGVTGAPLDSLTELAQRAKSGTPDWFMPYRAAEAEATALRFWGPLLVPGLLQTEGYARAVLSVESYTPERLDELVIARLERQSVIGRARVTAVIDHTVLLRCVGSPQIMADQCAHLSALAESQVIRLHVVPEGANVGLGGAFGIASGNSMSTVSLTTAIRDMTSTAADVIDDTLNLFDVILGASLPAVASLEFLRTQEETWKAQI